MILKHLLQIGEHYLVMRVYFILETSPERNDI